MKEGNLKWRNYELIGWDTLGEFCTLYIHRKSLFGKIKPLFIDIELYSRVPRIAPGLTPAQGRDAEAAMVFRHRFRKEMFK